MKHPKLISGISSMLLAVCVSSSYAGTYDQVVIFGDSLSDGGTYGSRFTTNPGLTAPEYLANQLGLPTTTWTLGGTNFAQGGQKVNSDSLTTPTGAPQRPISTQVTQYLSTTNGVANPNTLYLIQGGANDIFQNMSLYASDPATLQAETYQAGIDFATQVGKLAHSGAQYIIVQNVPNIGIAPAFINTPFASTATSLSQAYNSVVAAALEQQGTKVIMMDDYSLIGEIASNPTTYGFSNASGKACTSTSSISCSPSTLVSTGADSSYVFADDVHPTTAAQKLLAQYMSSTINAPTQISLLANAPISGGQRRADGLWTHRATHSDNLSITAPNSWRTFADIGHLRTHFDEGKYTSNYILIGTDRQLGSGDKNRLGASFGYQRYSGSLSNNGGSFTITEPTIGLHLSHEFSEISSGLLQASYGHLDASSIKRNIQLGSATRTEDGSSKGSHLSVSAQAQIQAGHFANHRFTHGPMARLGYEKVSLDGFSESGTNSTAMTFGAQTRKGMVANIGYQIDARYGRFQPYARIQYELNDTQGTDVTARLNSATSSFTTPAITMQNGGRVDIGTQYSLTPKIKLHIGAQSTLEQSNGREIAVNLGLSGAF